ncbi:hypothetical protein [Corynebacterium renale]|uniref:hypothetical protein n=1 Tax=Corynebacterium renale TaxID=1724 RepID=UPI000E080A47|nr:hypothetical protein [Corynebacterium renale]STC97566.1 Uncharacterised protein [Corynebacterium renale]
MGLAIQPSEVLAFNDKLDPDVVDILIRDGLAMARRVAPCIDEPGFVHSDAAVAIIRGAVLRWAESGSGGISSQQQTAGPFGQTTSFDNRQTRRSLFFPSEIKELEALCSDSKRKAFAFDTVPQAKRPPCADCGYLVGSTSSPCQLCGHTLRQGW